MLGTEVAQMPVPRTHELEALVDAHTIAIIGASANPTKIGGRPLAALLHCGYAGRIYAVNAAGGEIQGLAAHSSLDEVPERVDLAMIAVPGPAVLPAIEACARNGVKVAVLFSAGFAELGEEGLVQQERITRIATESGMRILGPNCIGAANMQHGVIATFAAATMLPRAHDMRAAPRIALASQSGAVGGHAVALASTAGFEFDPWITTGNQCDIDIADCIEFLARRADVTAIAAYLEGVTDGVRLERALVTARRLRKPVVMLKAGTSAEGAAAAAAHTASLVGTDAAYQALFDKYDVCRVNSLQELIDTAYALAHGLVPAGSRVLLLTASGGAGILMADAATEHGLDLPEMSPDIQTRLKELWPLAGAGNPVDTTAQVGSDPSLLPRMFDLALEGDGYDAVCIFLTYLPMMDPWRSSVLETLHAVRRAHPELPVFISAIAEPKARAEIESLRMPVLPELSDVVATTSKLTRLGDALARPAPEETMLPAGVPRVGCQDALTEQGAKAVLAAAGIPAVEEIVAYSGHEAVVAAETIGFPVVLKVLSAELPHKSEAGGVWLDLRDAESVTAAYDAIVTSVALKAPGTHVDGVIVAPMVGNGVETILGVVNDPVLGPNVMFGLGGLHVEVLKDVATRRAPVTLADAHAMIREVRGFPLLDGARGAPRADIDTLADAIVALSQFAKANEDTVASVDVNPFLVLPQGEGGVAVDALIVSRN